MVVQKFILQLEAQLADRHVTIETTDEAIGIHGLSVRQVEHETGSVGLNALTGEFEDLVKAGVIDPAKVTRSALQNAASIAGLMLTTEALVADKPEKEPAMPAMPGGGMGGMGGMGMM